MPTRSTTSSMPFSSSVASSAFSAEKQMPFMPWPSSLRSLSLAVTTATDWPALARPARIVGARSHFGSFIMTSVPRGDVEQVVAADAVHRRRHAGHDRQVVRVGEARDHAVGDQHRAGGEHLLQPRHVAVRDRLGDVVGLAAVDADDDGGLVGQAVAAAVDVRSSRCLLCCRLGLAWAAAGPRGWFLIVRSLLSMTCSNMARPASSASPEAIALTICRCSLAETGISQPSARFRRRNRLSSLISLR